LYLDTSALVASQLEEADSERIDAMLAAAEEPIVVSEFAVAEFASVLSRLIRTRKLSVADAEGFLADFDLWRARETRMEDIAAVDVRLAGAFVRRFDLKLLAPDALHLAVARRVGASVVTLDRRLASAGRDLGFDMVVPGEDA
jgi:predicted nucleic acid-binding protein